MAVEEPVGDFIQITSSHADRAADAAVLTVLVWAGPLSTTSTTWRPVAACRPSSAAR